MNDDDMLDAKSAAALLGVTLPTLYAYVSRKKLRAEPVPGSRERRYFHADVERLLHREQRHDSQIRSLRRGSAITVITPEGPIYRGRNAVKLADTASLEEVAAILWQCGPAATHSDQLPRVRKDVISDNALARVGAIDRAIATLPLHESVNPQAFDTSPSGQARTGLDVTRMLAAILLGKDAPSTEPIHRQVAATFGLSDVMADLVRRLLVVSADHGVEPATFAVRSAANAGITQWRSISVGLSVIMGRPTRIGETGAVRRFMAEILHASDCEQIVLSRIRDGEDLPGFHSDAYPHGDPRARALIAYCDVALSDDKDYRAVRRVLHIADQARGLQPNLALMASFIATRLRSHDEARGDFANSVSLLFPMARSIGWSAHAQEQSPHPSTTAGQTG